MLCAFSPILTVTKKGNPRDLSGSLPSYISWESLYYYSGKKETCTSTIEKKENDIQQWSTCTHLCRQHKL